MEPASDRTLIWEDPATPMEPALPGDDRAVVAPTRGARAGVFPGFVVALVLTVVLSAIGLWYLGLVFAVVALALGLLWSNAVLHDSERPLERAMARTTENVWASLRLTRVSLASWSRAGKEEVRLRTEQYALQRELDRTLRALGEAVYKADPERAERLRLDAVSIGNKIAMCGQALRIARASASRRVEAERSAVAPTQTIPLSRRRRSRRPSTRPTGSVAPAAAPTATTPAAAVPKEPEPTDSWW